MIPSKQIAVAEIGSAEHLYYAVKMFAGSDVQSAVSQAIPGITPFEWYWAEDGDHIRVVFRNHALAAIFYQAIKARAGEPS